MLLIEADPVLPSAVDAIRRRVMLFLGTLQPTQEFTTMTELREFLDPLLDRIEAHGNPRALTNVTLIYKNPLAVQIVGERMSPMGTFTVFQAPQCWRYFGPRLEEMKAMAMRREPKYVMAELERM